MLIDFYIQCETLRKNNFASNICQKGKMIFQRKYL